MLRLPSDPGIALAYAPDSLIPIGWQSAGKVPGAKAPLGIDVDQRMAYYLDRNDRLQGLDLDARIARPYVDAVRLAVVGPDGSAYAVDSAGRLFRVARRSSTLFPARFSTTPGSLIGTLNGQVVAVTSDSVPAIHLLSVEQSGDPVVLEGTVVAATYWGELVATASGDRIRLLPPVEPSRSGRVSLPDPAIALAFSPSGHRLYALTADRRILTFDRFTRKRLASLTVPGPARDFRLDPTGRWMLVRPADADSVWVVDLATSRLTAAIPTEWRSTLPLVAGTATLLAVQDRDVVAWNLDRTPVAPTASVSGGALDQWLPVPWVPAHRAPTVAAAAESALVVQDSGLLAPRPRSEPELAIYLQVSSSQNPDWARDLAAQLSDSGFPTKVWEPAPPEESYRVVIGPYPSRDEAEAVGRQLGRPFFIVTRPGPQQP